MNLEKRELSLSDVRVLGYLTMEQHGMFEELSQEEQEQAALNLQRR
jgi:hypothetical protein